MEKSKGLCEQNQPSEINSELLMRIAEIKYVIPLLPREIKLLLGVNRSSKKLHRVKLPSLILTIHIILFP